MKKRQAKLLIEWMGILVTELMYVLKSDCNSLMPLHGSWELELLKLAVTRPGKQLLPDCPGL